MFVLIDYVFTGQLNKFGPYTSYLAEAIFILLATVFYVSRLKLRFSLSKSYLLQLPLAVLSGFIIYKGAGILGLTIPFDLKSQETVVFLLFIGPLIEEGLYRHALWFPLQDIFGNRFLVVIGTAVIFAAGHFAAYYGVPAVLQSFVIYQTAYVLVIGIWWGIVRAQKDSVAATLPLHVLFNLGFYFGFLYA
jgi:membrane protease YdiL (CAAX protease family)